MVKQRSPREKHEPRKRTRTLTDSVERKESEKERGTARDELEKRVKERTAELESEIARRKGAEEQLHEKCEHIRDNSGRIVQSTGMVHDITERKEVERKLKESEAALTRAQQMAHVGHWDRHLSTGKVRWSDETYRIFGLRPQEREVDGPFLFEHIHPDDRASVKKAIRNAAEGVRSYNEIYRPVRPDGSVRWVHAKGEVIHAPDGKPIRLFGTILDITERKQMEEELRKSRDELEQRVKERTSELMESEEITRRQLAEIEGYYNMAPVGLGILNRQLKYIRVNRQ